MPRQLLSNVDLTLHINHRFKESDELDGDCREVRISGVQLYASTDETGCNWDVSIYNGSEACGGVFRKVIEEFRQRYNLKEE